MSTKKQKFVYFFAIVLAFALGMLTMSGCAYFSQERVAGTVSTVLEIAYVAGGATRVEQRIDQMVTDGKITEEQAAQRYFPSKYAGMMSLRLHKLDRRLGK